VIRRHRDKPRRPAAHRFAKVKPDDRIAPPIEAGK
jgi:hypothetical protein